MSKSALQKGQKRKMLHSTMLVTRTEEWCVDAETAEEALRFLEAGDGHRCHVGDCVQVQLHDLLD
jgi:hypothetical protein